MSTFMQKKENVVRKWYVLDAADKPLGKTAVAAADLLRGKNAPDKTVVRLRGLSPEKNYKLTDDDTNAVITKSGKELMEGLEITFDKAPGSRMLMYSAE